MEQKLLTVREAARLLTLREGTIRYWLALRKLAVVRLGSRCVRIPLSAVEEYIQANTIPALENRDGKG